MRQELVQRGTAALIGAALLAATMPQARASVFLMTLDGYLSTADAITPGPALTGDTPFIVQATFDDASPNLVAPTHLPGFVAYTPLQVTLSVLGQTYTVAPYDPATHTGVSVAIFDATSPFVPGHLGLGLIQDPLADGAGIVGDWLTASPPYSVSALTPTTLSAQAFFGVGFGSGPCISGCRTPAEQDAVTPIPLSLGGTPYALTLASYDLTYAPYIDDPLAQGDPTDLVFSATLTAVPEPGTLSLASAGVALAGLMGRWRRGQSRTARRRR